MMESSTGINLNTIDKYVTAVMRSARIPGLALSIVMGDSIHYMKGYGHADQSGRPVTYQTPFFIGSITKSITALAVMQLVDRGSIILDAPVQHYLPWFQVADTRATNEITVRMLLNQTSGLPQKPTLVTWTWPDEPHAIERHVRLLANLKPDFPPGQSFAYANANYVTLGMIVQAVAGQSYEAYIRQQIFTPLDMRNSFVSQDDALEHGMATGYRWWFGFPIPSFLPFNRSNLPAGFAISSAEDMAHYLITQMNGGLYCSRSLLSPAMIALMQAEPPTGEYGLGWESLRMDDRRLINADGATANFQTSIFFDPKAKIGVFVAANVMNALDGLSSSRSSASLGARSTREIIHRILDREDKKTFLFSALITTRGIAHTVLNVVSDRPIPKQGFGQRRASLIFDLVILILTSLLIVSLVRIPEWFSELSSRGIQGVSDLLKYTGLIALGNFTWLVLLLYLSRKIPQWLLLVLYQPDLTLWLKLTAVLLFLKGGLQLFMVWSIFIH